MIVAIALLTTGLPSSASARVMREELRTGDILYKSLRTLNDNRGYSWQAIAFTQIPDQQDVGQPESRIEAEAEKMYLRLVGFPGTVSIDRSKPLIVEVPGERQLTLPDRSSLIFKNGLSPQPNVGQYLLADVLEEVRSPMPLRLTLATVDGEPVELKLPRVIVEEWIDVNQRAQQARS